MLINKYSVKRFFDIVQHVTFKFLSCNTAQIQWLKRAIAVRNRPLVSQMKFNAAAYFNRLRQYVKDHLWESDEKDDIELLNSLDPTPSRKLLTLLKLNYVILIADTPTFKSFQVIVKYALIVALLAITFGFSPVAFPQGFAKFDVDTVCQNSNINNAEQSELLLKLAGVQQAEEQMARAKNGVDKLKEFVRNSYFKNDGIQVNNPVVIGNRPPSDQNQVFPSFPTGCSQQQLERTLNAALSQKCSQKVCVDDNLLNILCKTIDVPCQTSDLMDASANWKRYQEFQNRRINSENNTFEEVTLGSVSQQQRDLLQNTLNSLSFKVNIALSAYNFYKVVSLYFAPPLTILTGPFWSSLAKIATSITQPVFVVGVVVIWQLIEYLMTPDIVILLTKFGANPCFFDEKTTTARVKLVPDICNKVNTIKSDYLKLKYEYSNIETEVRAYGSCFQDFWKSHGITDSIPAENIFNSDIFFGESITFKDVKSLFEGEFQGKCDPPLFLQGVALPSDQTPKIPLPPGPIIGFLALVLLPTVVFQMVFRIVSFVHPQVLYNGKYEMLPGNIVPQDKILKMESMIVKHLRRMQVLQMVFWLSTGFVAIILAGVYK